MCSSLKKSSFKLTLNPGSALIIWMVSIYTTVIFWRLIFAMISLLGIFLTTPLLYFRSFLGSLSLFFQVTVKNFCLLFKPSILSSRVTPSSRSLCSGSLSSALMSSFTYLFLKQSPPLFESTGKRYAWTFLQPARDSLGRMKNRSCACWDKHSAQWICSCRALTGLNGVCRVHFQLKKSPLRVSAPSSPRLKQEYVSDKQF